MSSLHARGPAWAASLKLFAGVFAGGVLAGLVASSYPLIRHDGDPQRQVAAATSDDARVNAADAGGAGPESAGTEGRAVAAKPPPAKAAGDPCAGQTWPHIDNVCAQARGLDTREVRVVTSDRGTPAAPASPAPPAGRRPGSQAAPAEAEGTIAAAPPLPPPRPAIPQAQETGPDQPRLAAAPAAQQEHANQAGSASGPRQQTAEADAAETRPAAASTSRRAKRTRSAHTRSRDADRDGQSWSAQRVPDPATSPRGPMVVRVYDFPDGRRVTVYQRPGSPPPSISSLSRRRGIGTGALAYGDEPPPGRRVFILPRDQLY